MNAKPTEKVSVRAADLFDALSLFAPLLVRNKTEALIDFVRVAGQSDVLKIHAIIPEQLNDKGWSLLKVVGAESGSQVPTDLSIGVSLDMLQNSIDVAGDRSRLIEISMFERGLVMIEDRDDDMRTRAYLAKMRS